MDEFPRMLYRAPGAEPIHGSMLATLIVPDADAQAAALADGWSLTTDEAKQIYADAQAAAAAKAAADALAAVTNPDAPPTRAELEQKAAELGLKFDGRTSDRKLRDLIAATLET